MAGHSSKGSSNARKKNERTHHSKEEKQSNPNRRTLTIKSIFGFEKEDFLSWTRFRQLMNQPRDPAGLAVWRILFGLFMILDVFQERGMPMIDGLYSDPSLCCFPLFNFLKPLSVDWMYTVYLIMLIGAIGMCIGLFYRLSCILYFVPYWYIFLLDKTRWNNHSYLFGLISFVMVFLDSNRFWSLDCLWNRSIRNVEVPLWNYAFLKMQVFLVYFIAGLKKLDLDWVQGFSMETLSYSWVFDPFRLLGMSNAQIDFYIVHLCGLCLDLGAGYVLFFDATRPVGAFFVSSFHIMNSQMFYIGMFPYVMLATTSIFFYPDWPKRLLQKLPSRISSLLPSIHPPAPSEHCIYPQTVEKAKKQQLKGKDKQGKDILPLKQSTTAYHNLGALCFILFTIFQVFLPYSHFVTQGYNNWTNGLYGYSWDMMVHTWNVQHTKMKFVDRTTGKEGYLSPDYWTEATRWKTHADMVKQYASCVAERLKPHGIEEPALYVDIWLSMNGRFKQRMWDPNVDIVTAEWSPFKPTPWLMPLLADLSDWRSKLAEIENQLDDQVDVTFVADFPGLSLENFVDPHLGKTSLQVLNGDIIVEIPVEKKNISLTVGQSVKLPAGEFHNVHTVSKTPSCYMYVFVNTTKAQMDKSVKDFMQKYNLTWEEETGLQGDLSGLKLNMSDPEIVDIVRHIHRKQQEAETLRNATTWDRTHLFLSGKFRLMQLSLVKAAKALNHIVLGGESVGALFTSYMEQEETANSPHPSTIRNEL